MILDELLEGTRMQKADSLTLWLVVAFGIALMLAEHMHMSPEKVREIIRVSHEPLSLDFSLNEDEDLNLGDLIEDRSAQAPPDAATHSMLKEQVAGLLNRLTERERAVLSLRFGLIDGRSRTLEEVGKEFQVTRERIRQIEAKAMSSEVAQGLA